MWDLEGNLDACGHLDFLGLFTTKHGNPLKIFRNIKRYPKPNAMLSNDVRDVSKLNSQPKDPIHTHRGVVLNLWGKVDYQPLALLSLKAYHYEKTRSFHKITSLEYTLIHHDTFLRNKTIKNKENKGNIGTMAKNHYKEKK